MARRRRKTDPLDILIIVLVLLNTLAIVLIYSRPEPETYLMPEPYDTILIRNRTFHEGHNMSMQLVNRYSQPKECTIMITYTQDSVSVGRQEAYVGIIPASGNRDISIRASMPPGNITFDIEAICANVTR